MNNFAERNRYYVTIPITMTNPTSGKWDYHYEIRDRMVGASADTDRTVSTHDDKELAQKICRLANSAWLDVLKERESHE